MSVGGENEVPWYPTPPAGPPADQPGIGAPTDSGYQTLGGGPPTTPRKRRFPIVLGGIVVAALLAAVLAVVLPGGGRSAQAAVIASVDNAVASKTARGTLTMNIGSGQLTGSGAGTIDFSNGAMDFNVDVHAASIDQSLPIHLIYLGGTIYEGIPQISELFPGKSWLSLDLSGLANSGGSGGALNVGGNPAAMLRLLSQQGNNVVPLGSSKVNGVTVNGYRVTFDPAAMQRQLGSANIPSWMRSAISQVNLQNATETVYVDTAGQLRRTTMHVDVNGPSGKSASVDETFDLADYGVPVSITAPPASQVVDFQQFLQTAGGSSSN